MADFAPNYTPRYRVRYKVGGKNHSFTWRYERGATAATTAEAAQGRAQVFLNALDALRYVSFQILGADWANTDSDVFLPTLAPVINEGLVTEIGSSTAKMITQYRFEARAVTGSRYSFSLFGLSLDIDDALSSDFRISGTENADLSAARGALTEIGGAPLVAISGASLVWKPYVNVKINDHWLKRARLG